jgi:exopolyphosphatase/pppGpp-phosphohydrolase
MLSLSTIRDITMRQNQYKENILKYIKCWNLVKTSCIRKLCTNDDQSRRNYVEVAQHRANSIHKQSINLLRMIIVSVYCNCKIILIQCKILILYE